MELQDYEIKHLNAVYDGMEECTLFLKKNNDFPLAAPCKIALYGSAAKKTIKGGTGSGEVNSHFCINIYDGLKNAGFEITTDKWLASYEEECEKFTKLFVKQVNKEAKQHHINPMIYSMGKTIPEPEYDLPLDGEGDAAIYVVGRISGEGADRKAIKGDVLLTDTEKRDILNLNEKYAKFMLVLNVGGAVDLSPVKDVKNILVLSQLGTNTGTLLADILLGKKNPSGKLTTTWSAWEDYPELDFGDINNTRYKEGIYVGYRYFNSFDKKPLFPFGFGLSYSEFEISDEEVSLEGSKVTVTATVKNVSKTAGKEVVQVYVSEPFGKLDKVYQELAAFAKTPLLNAGESCKVETSFDLCDYASFDEETESYILEKGNYIVRVGNSSENTKVAAAVNLDETVITLKAKNSFPKPDFEDLKSIEKPTDLTGVKVLNLKASAIETKAVNYNPEYEIADEIKKLSVEEAAFFSNGHFNPNAKGAMGAIGMQSTAVAGAAGETSPEIKICKQLVMSDGPAGLRLAKDYYEDETGKHGIGTSMVPESMMIFASPLMKLILKLVNGSGKVKKGVEVKHNYCTDIPIGTAIAQSFNPDYATKCGDIVGEEMEMIGVHLWLAPALNIHRTIRLGRNFEYYSEDPLISGIMAAAITNGVQKHEGCGTTIKHFAFNNQEINRYASNSILSNRAAREIYTKGFGICVRMSQPCALMTSYNLVNGTHTSESRGLIEEILRNEYGYQGIVMTDWVLVGGCKGSIYSEPVGRKVVMSGNDLFMPGSKKDYDDVVAACKENKEVLTQLQINATRVYNMSKKLAK